MNRNNIEKIFSDSCSTNNNISNVHSSVEADVIVCDINGNSKNNNEEDNTNTISNCIDESNINNAVSESNDSIDDNAPSDVSIYVPVKTDYTAINQRDLNEEDSILLNIPDVTKITSGNDNNNDYTMFKFVNENMTTSDHYDNNVNQDVPSMNQVSMNKQSFHLSSCSDDYTGLQKMGNTLPSSTTFSRTI